MIARLLPVLAVALAAAFVGIALYITLAEQPARLALADGPSLAQWKISFGVGIALQGALTVVAGFAGLGAAWVASVWRGGVRLLMQFADRSGALQP